MSNLKCHHQDWCQGSVLPSMHSSVSMIFTSMILMLKSLTHFKLIFVYSVRQLSSFPKTIYWRDGPFLIIYPCFLCHKLIDHDMHEFIWGLSFCFTDQCACFYVNTMLFWLLQLWSFYNYTRYYQKHSVLTGLWLFDMWSKLERWKSSINGCLMSWPKI